MGNHYNYNKVRVSDIPQEGLSLSFELSEGSLSERVNKPLHSSSDISLSQPAVIFGKPLSAEVILDSDGQTIEMNGNLSAQYKTLCGRCGEEAGRALDVPVSLIFKPRKDSNDFDDIGYVLYEGEVLDCAEALEELLVLSIPYTITCSDQCKGLCPSCGVNLNISHCICDENRASDKENEEVSEGSPFGKLKQFMS